MDPNDEQFYQSVCCYDSFQDPHRIATRVAQEQHQEMIDKAEASVINMDQWFRNYIYSIDDDAINPLSILEYFECPRQTNGHDCGLFALGVTLYLACEIPVSKDIFLQTNVSLLRKKLVDIGLCSAKDRPKCSLQADAIFEGFNVVVKDNYLCTRPSIVPDKKDLEDCDWKLKECDRKLKETERSFFKMFGISSSSKGGEYESESEESLERNSTAQIQNKNRDIGNSNTAPQQRKNQEQILLLILFNTVH